MQKFCEYEIWTMDKRLNVLTGYFTEYPTRFCFCFLFRCRFTVWKNLKSKNSFDSGENDAFSNWMNFFIVVLIRNTHNHSNGLPFDIANVMQFRMSFDAFDKYGKFAAERRLSKNSLSWLKVNISSVFWHIGLIFDCRSVLSTEINSTDSTEHIKRFFYNNVEELALAMAMVTWTHIHMLFRQNSLWMNSMAVENNKNGVGETTLE